MFKKLMCLTFLALVAVGLHAADGGPASSSFWGTITAIDPAQRAMTLHNKKRKLDQRIVWNNDTKITNKKKSVPADSLAIGNLLQVVYVDNLGQAVARSISVRTVPSRKKTTLGQ